MVVGESIASEPPGGARRNGCRINWLSLVNNTPSSWSRVRRTLASSLKGSMSTSGILLSFRRGGTEFAGGLIAGLRGIGLRMGGGSDGVGGIVMGVDSFGETFSTAGIRGCSTAGEVLCSNGMR